MKYKLGRDRWNRADLYEAISFAAAFRSTDAAIINFCVGPSRLPPALAGDHVVVHLAWDIAKDPPAAADNLADEVIAWLQATEATPAYPARENRD